MKEVVIMNAVRKYAKLLVAAVPLAMVASPVNANQPNMSQYTVVPPMLSKSQTPLIMLALSKDHQLFFKAYSDYDDLDGDGTLEAEETTYNHGFLYYGYFDSKVCYEYDSSQNIFRPKALADENNYCTAGANQYWSGNFLNWASMTRMDTVRKLLYGGYRSTDTTSSTVLERAYLPNDAHSFAKYYNGNDLSKLAPVSAASGNGITICNTTVSNTALSQNVTSPPLIRVAEGNYSLWAANERWQCRWSDEKSETNGVSPEFGIASSNPPRGSDYVARVEVCVEDLDQGSCKRYPGGSYKPTGILQQYGDEGLVHFGLMTGSYNKNKSGGVLRKNIGKIDDEINVATDGTFKAVPNTGGIIGALDALRIVGYNHTGAGHLDGTYNNADNCAWSRNSFNDGQCRNWGNPVAEILTECYRYFGNKGANTNFNANDSSLLPNLKVAAWQDPITVENACANLNVIMINASTISYDGNGLAQFESDFNTNLTNLTKEVGDGEGITGNEYFVGENGTDNNQLCTAKTVSSLGEVKGTCPDAPRLEGTYKMAGAAYYAKTNDLRADREGDQTVTTYGVALAAALPVINIPVPGSATQKVQILPACRNASMNPAGNCALVDFKVFEAHQQDPADPSRYKGSFYVNWEDSEQGGDFDQDMWGIISYEITATQIKVTTKAHAQSTPDSLGFGYVISGTTQDGFHVHSGVNNFRYFDPDDDVSDCGSRCNVGGSATSHTYTIGESSAKLLEQPLFYAAKWGGFRDLNNDGTPDQAKEWDTVNNKTGALEPDGLPDNYFYATNPTQLEDQLKAVLNSIVRKTASGTNAAVVSNSSSGVGAVYQALYQPSMTVGSDSVSWVGKLHAVFIDQYGNLREDAGGVDADGNNTGPNGQLDGFDIDPVIEIVYDTALNDTIVKRYTTADGKNLVFSSSDRLNTLKPIWSAVDQLADMTNEQVRDQRTYGQWGETKGRHIFTFVDGDQNGVPAADEVIAFDTASITTAAGHHRYLDVEEDSLVNLVNYIRGDDSHPTYRNRTIDYDGNGR